MDTMKDLLKNLKLAEDIDPKAKEPRYSKESWAKLRAAGFPRDRDLFESSVQDPSYNGIYSAVQEWQRAAIEAQDMAILEAIKRADASMTFGVKVTRTRSGYFLSVEVSEDVPFGEVHVHDTGEDLKLTYDALNERYWFGPE